MAPSKVSVHPISNFFNCFWGGKNSSPARRIFFTPLKTANPR